MLNSVGPPVVRQLYDDVPITRAFSLHVSLKPKIKWGKAEIGISIKLKTKTW